MKHVHVSEKPTRLFKRPGEEPIRVAECDCGATFIPATRVDLDALLEAAQKAGAR